MSKYPFLESGAREIVDSARKQKADVVMMVEGFITDEEAKKLRDMLWYAHDKNVIVTIVPSKGGIDSQVAKIRSRLGQDCQIVGKLTEGTPRGIEPCKVILRGRND